MLTRTKSRSRLTAPNGLLVSQFLNGTDPAFTTGNAYRRSSARQYRQLRSATSANSRLHNLYQHLRTLFQDDWHATQRLTLNLGLRMSFYGTYREENNLAYNFDPSVLCSGRQRCGSRDTGSVTGNPYNGWVDCGVTPGVPAGCMKNHWLNPAPRIGFAFDPQGRRQMGDSRRIRNFLRTHQRQRIQHRLCSNRTTSRPRPRA